MRSPIDLLTNSLMKGAIHMALPVPEVVNLRAALRAHLATKLELQHHRNAHTLTSPIEMRLDGDLMRSSARIQRLTMAAERASVGGKIPHDLRALSKRYVGTHATYMDVSPDSVWHETLGRWI